MPALDHVVLRAADPAKLERFYLDVLRLSFEKRQGELAQLRAGTHQSISCQRMLLSLRQCNARPSSNWPSSA
jgi:catechol 2,3-dioxygenase-like lactoylglutathione lyase family enzyme